MNRKRLFLALALGVVLVLLCASVALAADRPIKVSMEFSKYKLSGPETITVSITVTNIGDGDLPAPVTLYFPDGSKIDDFGSPTLSVGKSKRWTGDWDVTQDELNAGKVTFENVRSNYINGGGAMFVEPQQRVIDSLVALDAKVLVGVRSSGTTAQRPTDVYVGYCYFDTSLGGGTIPNGKPIWASAITETTDIVTGNVTREVTWVDSTGTTV